MTKFATNITKEDFKRALTDCFKKAWVWHNGVNFKTMIDWQNNQELLYYDKEKITTENDFNQDIIAIDLIKIYQDNDDNFHENFMKQFNDPEGFSYDRFPGETLADGFAVGEKAQSLFILRGKQEQPGLKILNLSDDSYKQALIKTSNLFKNEKIKYSYGFELAFAYDQENLRIRPDILRFKANNHVDIIEIKATSKAKSEHFFDLAYQIYVLEKNNLIVDNAFLGHLNPDFVWGIELGNFNLSEVANELYQTTNPITFEVAQQAFSSTQIVVSEPKLDLDQNLEQLFKINPVYKKTRSGDLITYIEAYRQFNQNQYLDDLIKQLTDYFVLPNREIRSYLERETCSFQHKYKATKKNKRWLRVDPEPICYHILPWFDLKKESIFNLTGSSNFTNHHKAAIYRQTGLVYLENIDRLEALEAKITNLKRPIFLEPHYRHFEVYKSYLQSPNTFEDTMILKRPLEFIKDNLKYYQNYPIFMYDFETVKWAIPRFPKTKTYQQIPFQYSIDVLLDETYDYHEPKTMHHYDFLARDCIDPRPEFIKSFLKVALNYGPGKYVAYNDAFEKMVLKHLAFLYPEYQIPLLYVVQNTIDLMTFFKGKKNHRPWFEIYHPKFRGSYSIKKTQPALDPNFSYHDLKINKGDQASQTFREFIDGYLPLELWQQKIHPDLLTYCNRDTLAMVVLLQRIKEIYLKGVKNDAQI